VSKSKKIFALGIVAIVLTVAVASWYTFRSESNGCRSFGSKVGAPVTAYFSETLQNSVIKKKGQPIEGFEPFMFMEAYPGLNASDFNCVAENDGAVYIFKDGQLTFTPKSTTRVSSAEGSVTPNGMNQLLQNIAARLGRPLPHTNAEVDDIINVLSANPIAVATSTINQEPPACPSIPNGSTQTVRETTRLFINIPKDVYPDKEHNLQFKTISGNATSGYISNGGLPGQAFEATPSCWSYYNEFDGIGEVDLTVKSKVEGMPDYFVRFIVVPTQ
jgi:hypothetical protein